MKNRFYIVLGDWSSDGHGKSKKILIESNLTHDELQKAYLQSCKKTKIAFHNDHKAKLTICVQYEQAQLTREIFDALQKLNCPINDLEFDGVGDSQITDKNCEDCYFNETSFVNTLMWFISLSLPSTFNWKIVEDKTPIFNGYWDKDLNIMIGYGLYQ